MKKILTLLILTALTLCLTSCAEIKILHCDGCEKEVTVKENSNMTEEWTIFCNECEAKESNKTGYGAETSSQTEAPVKTNPTSEASSAGTDADILPRTKDISAGLSDDKLSFTYSTDMNYDGSEENISIRTLKSEEGYTEEMTVKAGDLSVNAEIYDGTIQKVYDCDIDTSDGARDIAIITMEVSGDPRIRIFSYANALDTYKFKEDSPHPVTQAINDDNWLGYANTLYFNVNQDDSIIIEEQTNSYGMWSVYKQYKRDGDGVFNEVKPDKYKILPDIMRNREEWANFTDKELEMWKKDYILAYTDYSNDEISVSAGEYFKVIYDDGNNNIFIETESGKSGWVSVDYLADDNSAFYKINDIYFAMAG